MSEKLSEISDELGIEIFDVQSGRSWDKVLAKVEDPNRIPVRVLGNRVLPLAGVFSDREIHVGIKLEHIGQYPYKPELIGGSSVDLQLGNYFYRTDIQRDNRADFYNFHSQEDIDEYFGDVIKAEPLRENSRMMHKFGHTTLRNIDPDSLGIHIKPHERLLGHTMGAIGIRSPGASSYHNTSTNARNGFSVLKDSDIGNPDWIGPLTVELENTNNEDIWLPVGMIIAQARFYGTGGVAANYLAQGSYQSEESPKEALEKWHYTNMKPKVKKVTPMYSPRDWRVEE